MKRKHIFILAVALFVPILFVGWYVHSMGKISRGYETAPLEQYDYLSSALKEEINFEGLDGDWIIASWANGFQDHTFLYKLLIPPIDLERLRASFPPLTQSSSASILQAGAYLGPSTAPDWWDTASLDSMDYLAHRGQRRYLRLNVVGESAYLIVLSM